LRHDVNKRLAMLMIAATLSACAVSTVDPLTVPLSYVPPTDPLEVPRTLSCPAIAAVKVADLRSDPLLGERHLESKPLKADVTAGGDAAAWVDAGIQNFIAAYGLRPGGAGPTLAIDLKSLHTSENVWHRAGYEARIDLTAHVLSASGRSCWQGTFTGKAGNYGYAGSIVDYQETLNYALARAALLLVDSPEFEQGLCHCD
jgi:hypothetical protein